VTRGSQIDDDVAGRLGAADQDVADGGAVERFRSVEDGSRDEAALAAVTDAGAAGPADRDVARFG
jgi:hypothetical protein